MWTRRQFVSRGALGLLGVSGVALALPGDNPKGTEGREALPDGSASKDMITPRTDQAVERGLAFLNGTRRGRVLGSFGTGGYTGNVAVTSLAALAFMAAGNQPDRGPYGRIVLDALRYVLAQENQWPGGHPGFLHKPTDSPDHGPMYGHGFGTLFLAEVSGMVHDRVLREELDAKLHRAVNLILVSQNSEGGWRYGPTPHDADISVTICQIMALRAARNAGIAVPKSKVDKCVEYVKACQDGRFGYFRYQKQGGGDNQAFARTAAGVVALYSAGIYKGPEVEAGLEYLRRNRPVGGPMNRFGILDIQYFYGHYYAIQAMWAAGGDYWKEWYPGVREEMLGRQLTDGSWSDGICTHYATAMACIILQVPNNYLPFLQK
ncbi:MAG TPA: prenyltransferase [Planctomycetales bacterium]|jgi:hypothetical protein|nr:prenyltransferase [Planctomycetales bacterium]